MKRTVPFWNITQRVAVITYRRFGTSYQSHLHLLRGRKPEVKQAYEVSISIPHTYWLLIIL